MLHHVKSSIGEGDSCFPGGEIILCSHQPGNLKISKKACRKRHLHSWKSEYFESLLANDPFGDGCCICRKCSIGKQALKEEKTGK